MIVTPRECTDGNLLDFLGYKISQKSPAIILDRWESVFLVFPAIRLGSRNTPGLNPVESLLIYVSKPSKISVWRFYALPPIFCSSFSPGGFFGPPRCFLLPTLGFCTCRTRWIFRLKIRIMEKGNIVTKRGSKRCRECQPSPLNSPSPPGTGRHTIIQLENISQTREINICLFPHDMIAPLSPGVAENCGVLKIMYKNIFSKNVRIFLF